MGSFADLTVVTLTPITSTWGNKVRNGVVHVYASAAARNADITSPAEGMMCWITGTKRFEIHDGTGWMVISEPWQSHTPTFAGSWTLGNGSFSAQYKRQGRSCTWRGVFTVGNGTKSGQLLFNPPFAPVGGPYHMGTCTFHRTADNSARAGVCKLGTSLETFAQGTNAGDAYAYFNGLAVAATIPFTWAASDTLNWDIPPYEISAADARD